MCVCSVDRIVTNNIISGSTVAAITLLGTSGSTILSNNTIVSNPGYGIYSGYPSSIKVKNTILWDNGNDLYNCSASYSDVGDGDAGEGNISLNPEFVDPASRDYHIRESSPCIDTGSNIEVVDSCDIDGENRIVDGDRNGTEIVDIGADEFTGLGLFSVETINFHGVELGDFLDISTPITNNSASTVIVNNVYKEFGSNEFSCIEPSFPCAMSSSETKLLIIRYSPQYEIPAEAVFLLDTDFLWNPHIFFTVQGYGVVMLYTPGPGLIGDVDGNGVVNVLDMTKIVRIILELD
ncbi:MAG: hypothetical protein JW712_13155 [Dehalococcoidales bacterium]|nr:hypothetical protein [Dehalococcoidales bacterium]